MLIVDLESGVDVFGILSIRANASVASLYVMLLSGRGCNWRRKMRSLWHLPVLKFLAGFFFKLFVW